MIGSVFWSCATRWREREPVDWDSYDLYRLLKGRASTPLAEVEADVSAIRPRAINVAHSAKSAA
jgi:hypothetical protein